MSGLRLDQKDAALKGGKAGADILPGKSAESRLIRLVAGLDRSSCRRWAPTSPRQRSAFCAPGSTRAWSGPHGAPHWSFQKIQRPAAPAVRNRAWARNPIDNFILARLEREGIAPRPKRQS